MRRALAAGILTFGLAGGALAESLPLPATDYRSKGTMAGGMTVEYRHSNGKMRVEMRAPEMPQPMVGYFDVKTRKGLMVMTAPGMPPMAIETGLDDEGGTGISGGTGQRVGRARVAGEDCEEWRIDAKSAEEKETDMVACVTRDGIMLRMVGNIDGKRQTVFEVTELDRAPQDAKRLVPPPGLKPMKMPAGMMPPRK